MKHINLLDKIFLVSSKYGLKVLHKFAFFRNADIFKSDLERADWVSNLAEKYGIPSKKINKLIDDYGINVMDLDELENIVKYYLEEEEESPLEKSMEDDSLQETEDLLEDEFSDIFTIDDTKYNKDLVTIGNYLMHTIKKLFLLDFFIYLQPLQIVPQDKLDSIFKTIMGISFKLQLEELFSSHDFLITLFKPNGVNILVNQIKDIILKLKQEMYNLANAYSIKDKTKLDYLLNTLITDLQKNLPNIIQQVIPQGVDTLNDILTNIENNIFLTDIEWYNYFDIDFSQPNAINNITSLIMEVQQDIDNLMTNNVRVNRKQDFESGKYSIGDIQDFKDIILVYLNMIFNEISKKNDFPKEFNKEEYLHDVRQKIDKFNSEEDILLSDIYTLYTNLLSNQINTYINTFLDKYTKEEETIKVNLKEPITERQIVLDNVREQNLLGQAKQYARQLQKEYNNKLNKIVTDLNELEKQYYGSRSQYKEQHKRTSKLPFAEKVIQVIKDQIEYSMNKIEAQSSLISLYKYVLSALSIKLDPQLRLTNTELVKSINGILNKFSSQINNLIKESRFLKQGSLINIDGDKYIITNIQGDTLFLVNYDELKFEKRATLYTCPMDCDYTLEEIDIGVPLRQCLIDNMIIKESACESCMYNLNFDEKTLCGYTKVIDKLAKKGETSKLSVKVQASSQLDEILNSLQIQNTPKQINSLDTSPNLFDRVVKKGTSITGVVIDQQYDNSLKILWETGQESIVWPLEINKIVD